MSGVREFTGAGEKVLTVVRKEDEMVKPADVRCRAKDPESEDGRCSGQITMDNEGTWLVWCEPHQAQEEAARSDGGPRVERVEVGAGS